MPPLPEDPVDRRRDVVLAGHLGDVALARHGWADPSPPVRAAALGALHRLNVLDADTLSCAMRDPEPLVRRRACELHATRPELGVEALAGGLADADVTVVEAACFALGELGEAGAGATSVLAVVATTHDDALCREAAVAALGAIGHPAGLPAILAATTDKAAVRRRAVLALAPFEGSDVDDALQRAATDRDWQVRQAAEDLGVLPASP